MATAKDPRLFGDDLRLLGDLSTQDGRARGADLAVVARVRGLDPAAPSVDLALLHGVENLKQALLLRFLTPLGELAPLGHPDYGCRLYELIGEPNTETQRNRAKLFVLEALAAEPRIEKVRAVSVRTRRSAPTDLEIRVEAIARGVPDPLNLVIPFSLAGGVAR